MPRMVTCDVFDSTQRESTTPKGVASTSHLPPGVASYRRQPRAIESTTPMGLPYHCSFITTTTTGMRITLRRSCAHHFPFITAIWHRDGAHYGHLSSRHNTRNGNAIMWSCVPHGHLSPNHGINVSCNMDYHHTITRGVPMLQRRIAHSMSIHGQATA